jgi:hypothetical protein
MSMGSTARILAAPAATARPARPSRWHAGTLAAAGTIPETAVNAGATLAGSAGHPPANQRTAIPARAYESGSGHGHDAAPACHPHPPRAPPSPPCQHRRRSPHPRSYVLAALRALHLDPRLR